MNTREKGRSLERREARVWREAGWLVEDRHPAKFVGPGRIALCDFFERYDLIAISRDRRMMAFIQVSTESPNSHEPALGIGDRPTFMMPDGILNAPRMSPYQDPG